MRGRITDSFGRLQKFSDDRAGEENIFACNDSIRSRADQMRWSVLLLKPLCEGASIQEGSDQNCLC